MIGRRPVYTVAVSIFLIRHGETEDNAARVVQLPSSPLSKRGRAQAERLARRLASVGIVHVVSSDFPRAAATAEAVQRASGAPLSFEPLLQERNFGDLRGTPYADLGVDMFAEDYAPPRGETWAAFHQRVDQAWERVQALASRIDGHLAVVTHGLVCRSLTARHLTLAAGDTVPLRWENAAVTIAEGPAPWRVCLLNCVAHLADLDGAPAGPLGSV